MAGGGFGGGPFGGAPFGGGGVLGVAPSPFDIYCFEHCLTMFNILSDPIVSAAGFNFSQNAVTCDLDITNSYASTAVPPYQDTATLQITTAVPQVFTLEWNVKFHELPQNFNDLVNEHIFVGATDAAGPCAGLFVSKIGIMYVGGVHHAANNVLTPAHPAPTNDLVVDSTTQQIPDSFDYITTGEYITFRLCASYSTKAVYIFVTKTSDLTLTGHQLRAVVPMIEATDLATLPTDRTTVSVRGSTPEMSVSFDSICMSSALLIPNLLPVSDAGTDQAAQACSIVQLDGSGSFDPEGAPLTYLWRLLDAPSASEFAIELNDGTTLADPSGFVDRFYSVGLGTIDASDPIVVGDVLLLDGEARTVVGKAGAPPFFLLFAVQDIPENLANVRFKLLRQRGISGPTTVKPTFLPDIAGFYKFDLVVNDGLLSSKVSGIIINVLESPLPRGCTPDLTFIFDYLSDFWKLVEDREPIAAFWGALAQVTSTELYTLWQTDYCKSLRDIQRHFARRWLHYDPILGEPIPELTKVRAVWAGIDSQAFPPAGLAGIFGTTLELTSPALAEPFTHTFLSADPVTATQFRDELAVALNVVSEDFTVLVFTDAVTTDEFVRIVFPNLLSVGENTTTPETVFIHGAQNGHPLGFNGGAATGPNTYKVNTSLEGLDIQENDFLCLDGVAFRILSVISDPLDDLTFQRVVLKEILPTTPTDVWDISGYVTSELLNFYSGLVDKDDSVYFEVIDTTGLFASTAAIREVVQTTVLGASKELPGALPIVISPLGDGLAKPDELAVRLAKLVRRSHLPVTKLVLDIPTLTEKIVIEDDEATLRRNVDYFIEDYRGQKSIRFVATLGGQDVWEGFDPPDRLWAEYTYLDNKPTIEANFGIPADFTLDEAAELPDDLDYLSAVRGLWYAYFNGPTLYNLRVGIQILLGLPFAEEAGTIEEIRTDFSPNEGRILIRDTANTDIVRSYNFPVSLDIENSPVTGVPYVAGDTVALFAPLVEGAEVIDYISDPEWFQGIINQGIFYEVEKFFRFLVRVNSAIFNLPSLIFVRDFILKIKPTYTYPLFLVLHEVGDTEVSTVDLVEPDGLLIVTDNVCESWFGASTTYDDPRPAGGGWRNQFDSMVVPPGTAPTFPTPTLPILWAYDKTYLCPADPLVVSCCVTYAMPTIVAVDSCLHVDSPITTKYVFTDTGAPFTIPVAPAGYSIPGSFVAVFVAGSLDTVKLIITGGPGTLDPSAYELCIDVNAVEEASLPFISNSPNTEVTFSTAITANNPDPVTVRIRPSVGGRITAVAQADLVDGETFTLDDGTNPATVFEFDVDGGGVSPGNVAVDVSSVATAEQVKLEMIIAINAVATLDMTAFEDATTQVGLVHDSGSAGTAVAISDTVADAGFVVLGMTGAQTTPDWTSISVRATDVDTAGVWTLGLLLPAGTYCGEQLIV